MFVPLLRAIASFEMTTDGKVHESVQCSHNWHDIVQCSHCVAISQ